MRTLSTLNFHLSATPSFLFCLPPPGMCLCGAGVGGRRLGGVGGGGVSSEREEIFPIGVNSLPFQSLSKFIRFFFSHISNMKSHKGLRPAP